jgi:hypothetical protein
MRIPASFFPLFTAGALLLACGGDPAAPATGNRPGPSFDLQNGPATPGQSVVLRTDYSLVIWETVDPSQDLIVRHFNAEDLDLCGGATPPPLLEIQWVLAPPATQRLGTTGELPVYVYRLSELPPPANWGSVSPEFCADLASKWIYRGATRYIQHDNDFDLSGVRTNAITRILIGTVFDHVGQRYAYQEFLESNDRPGSGDPPGPLAHYFSRSTLSIK